MEISEREVNQIFSCLHEMQYLVKLVQDQSSGLKNVIEYDMETNDLKEYMMDQTFEMSERSKEAIKEIVEIETILGKLKQ